MDGTLIDSTPGVLAAWEQFGQEFGFDPVVAAREGHGRRPMDSLGELCNLENPEELTAVVARFEEEVIKGRPTPLPGAKALLAQIDAGSSPTARGWTIVTSATKVFASQVLERTGIPSPVAGYVTSEDVTRGKPQPDPYLAGAERIGVDPKNCLVVEDAPLGMLAGRAAGARTLAVCTSHTREQIMASGAAPDFIVDNLTRVSARWVDGKVEVEINDSL